ncbi:unnamed protein product, partial [Mesorhabditis spiculigera]
MIHDNLAKIFEIEPFGDIGAWTFVFLMNFRFIVQIYLFFLISILHLLAIFAPTKYRRFDTPTTVIAMAIPVGLALVQDTIYSTVCNCLYYDVEKQDFTVHLINLDFQFAYDIFDKALKVSMISLLIGTDIALVSKLYRIDGLGAARRRAVRTTDSSLATVATVERQDSTIAWTNGLPPASTPAQRPVHRVRIDKRLALGFFYITLAYTYVGFYYKLSHLIPTNIREGFALFQACLEISKCTVYVFIVTYK